MLSYPAPGNNRGPMIGIWAVARNLDSLKPTACEAWRSADAHQHTAYQKAASRSSSMPTDRRIQIMSGAPQLIDWRVQSGIDRTLFGLLRGMRVECHQAEQVQGATLSANAQKCSLRITNAGVPR